VRQLPKQARVCFPLLLPQIPSVSPHTECNTCAEGGDARRKDSGLQIRRLNFKFEKDALPTMRATRRLLLIVPAAGSSLLIGAAAFTGLKSTEHVASAEADPQALPASAVAFINKNCVSCHGKQSPAGALDLTAAVRGFKPLDQKSFGVWVKIHDRVAAGEMPPAGSPAVPAASKSSFIATVSNRLSYASALKVKHEGRAVWRRMNRLEYEETLRDLLDAPWLQVKQMLPEDGLAYRLNKSGEALDISHVQMSRYLSAADYALREVLPTSTEKPARKFTRYYAREMGSFAGLAKFNEFNGSPERATFALIGNEADIPALMGKAPMTVGPEHPEKREQESIGVVASSYEPIQPYFDHFYAPISGHYKLRLRTHTFWAHPQDARHWWTPSRTNLSAGRTQEPVSLYALRHPQQLRKLGDIDSFPEPTTGEIDCTLIKGETIMIDAARFFRSRPPGWHNPLATRDGQPGVTFHWLEVEGPILEGDRWPTRGQQLLFGDLPLKPAGGSLEPVAANEDADAARLISAFMKRAIRRPVAQTDIDPFISLYRRARTSGASFKESLLTAYTGVLCSPAFVTLQEKPGTLDDWALACRLSYFLWNSEPDTELRKLAEAHQLHNTATLLQQADRLLEDPRSRRFVDAFLDYWLDLRKTENTSPDEVLYPDYYLDDYLVQSAVEETRSFFAELLKSNLPARNLVDSSFVTVNDRMASLYGIPDVKGTAFRKVELPKGSVRGGLITQASVLKVTANGTTTSPVLRGVWITERILGQPVPPPPPAVPAVEPDIRGATTIREQLDKHRTLATCKSCHARIDPPGFALENFDVFGGYRDHYRALGDGVRTVGFGKNGQPFTFHDAQPVDASGVLTDGRHFNDVRELKQLILKDQRQVARNLVRQLVTYSTGAPVQFGDRSAVENILDQSKPDGYGVKTLIHAIIKSELFRNK
jgi:mono/diheme cytochrome c family protein